MRALSALLLTLVLLTPAVAQERLPSIQRIVDSGSLVIAVIEVRRPPMINHGEDGGLSGFDIDLGRDIARVLGVTPTFRKAGPRSEDVYAMVAGGEADIGLSYLTASVRAGMLVLFTDPYMIESHTVLLNRAKTVEFGNLCPSRSDLRRMVRSPGTIGLLRRSFYDEFVEQDMPEGKPERFESFEEMASALAAGRISASVQGELEAKFYLSRHPQANLRLRLCDIPDVRHRVAMAVRPDGFDLARWLDLYITQRGIIIDLDSLLYREDRVVY